MDRRRVWTNHCQRVPAKGFVEVALRWDKQSTLLEEPPLDSNAVMVNIIYLQIIKYIPLVFFQVPILKMVLKFVIKNETA